MNWKWCRTNGLRLFSYGTISTCTCKNWEHFRKISIRMGEPGGFRIRIRGTVRTLQLPLSEFHSQFAVHLAFLTVPCQRFVHCTILGWHVVRTVPTRQVKVLFFLTTRYSSQSCVKRLLASPFLSVHLSAPPDLKTRLSRNWFLWNRLTYVGAFAKIFTESSSWTKITGIWHEYPESSSWTKITGIWHEYPSTFMNTLVINFTMAALYRACKHCTAYMLAVGQWRTEGSFGVFKPPPPNSEGPPKSCQTQPDCENC